MVFGAGKDPMQRGTRIAAYHVFIETILDHLRC